MRKEPEFYLTIRQQDQRVLRQNVTTDFRNWQFLLSCFRAQEKKSF